MNKFVTILSFSTRQNGNCAAVADYLMTQYERSELYAVDLAPCGGCDYECLKIGTRCPKRDPKQAAIMDAICRSVLVYFIVPNYCGYPSANYFAFNERSVGYFNMDRDHLERYMRVPKRFVVISNTEGFEDAMRQQTCTEPEILYLKSGKYGKRSTDGDILDSEAAKADLTDFLSKDGL